MRSRGYNVFPRWVHFVSGLTGTGLKRSFGHTGSLSKRLILGIEELVTMKLFKRCWAAGMQKTAMRPMCVVSVGVSRERCLFLVRAVFVYPAPRCMPISGQRASRRFCFLGLPIGIRY